jgi:hypothetical protein
MKSGRPVKQVSTFRIWSLLCAYRYFLEDTTYAVFEKISICVLEPV